MKINATRLTLYALLGAVEDDLREILVSNLGETIPLHEILEPGALERCKERALNDGLATVHLSDAIYYLDLGDLCPTCNSNANFFSPDTADYIKQKTALISKLIAIRNRVCHFRPLLGTDFTNVFEAAQALADDDNLMWDALRNCLDKLAHDAGFVLSLKIPSWDVSENAIPHNLPNPDFDETGFIGRQTQLKELKSLIDGHWNVISLIGEGGLGKTAIALQAAYHVVDNCADKYDAVVWVTSKTTVLTSHEIRQIEGAITNSLDLVFKAIHGIGENTDQAKDPIEQLIELMTAFRVFLIVDNLETVLDDRMREFFGRLPDGSKVLVTSRIGIGAYDRPIKIPPFEVRESIELLRKMAKIHSLSTLTAYSNSRLEPYCKRMGNNPLHIKWFVLSVASGSSPEKALADPSLILEFCLSNVYEHLTSDAKSLVDILFFRKHNQTTSELSYLSEMAPIELRKRLNELLTANMAVSSSTALAGGFETTYGITELCRKYLARHHPLPQDRQKVLQRKRQQLVAEKEQQQQLEGGHFNVNSVEVKSNGDVVIAKLLSDALRHTKKHDFDSAFESSDQARELAPTFYETYRVSAWIKNASGDIVGAQEDYEEALELNPNSVKVLYFYAQFQLRAFDDAEAAERLLVKAAGHASDSPEIKLELARCNLYQSKFSKCREIALSVAERESNTERQRTIAFDLALQSEYRAAEAFLVRQEVQLSIAHIENFINLYLKIPAEFVDSKMQKHLSSMLPVPYRAFKYQSDSVSRERLDSIIEKLEELDPSNSLYEIQSGYVKTVKWDRDFGFIAVPGGPDVYFQKRDLIDRADWTDLTEGQPLKYRINSSIERPSAKMIRLVRDLQ
ncbi:NB-ARC domain-containing protein [Aureliella helgolandensis]|uniref:NB-ARC domain protein n=1 Tax=Aureliella helgolandensis TaxID=2527968 RepID=A0A518GFM6_9BACT|nr:NB-ARC domain-containing protein [Aureliella helgolandensis]QDV27367.1 NB-ARC domain protein [Aureliella helgolandensis]